jgi:aryl-alcohol dehydrogenase-like predicted oxidoreductase
MQYRPLGDSDLQVSALCLGTMTWGEQNDQSQAFEQLDYALAQGINFIDTAEMYPVPARAETQGRTESIIGNWLQQRGNRNKVILATKIAGPGGDWLTHFRGGNNCLDKTNIEAAVDESLRRLQTDYIDYYQLHWPDRETNFFGKPDYPWPMEDHSIPLQETLEALNNLVTQGKIRHIGISNETPWGVMQCLHLSECHDLPRVQGIQNPYNLLNRSYEVGLAEITHREKVGLLAYSPLGFGVLSGKYLNRQLPDGSRLQRFPEYNRYSNPQAQAATAEYVALAKSHGLNPAQMALAFVTRQPFVTSNIIGATTMEQLRSNISSTKLLLSRELLDSIEAIHTRYTNPSP